MRHRRSATASLLVCLGICLGLGASAGAASAEHGPAAHASVIGGQAATIAEFPSIAFLQGEDVVSPYSCTGSVVAPRVILTAGHCVEDIESSEVAAPQNILVATGVANLKQATKANISLVSQALVYPGFNPGKLRGDAGLLILQQPIAAPPIALATAADAGLLSAGTPLDFAGWGLTDPKAKDAPAQLQSGATVAEDNATCRKQARRYYPFFDESSQLCTLDAGHKVSGCHGDSGGPLIAHRADGIAVEVGVVSVGSPGCSRNLPNIYTRVDTIDTWVAQWIAAIEAGGPPPAIKVPRAHTPFLAIPRAKELAGIAFAEDFRNAFVKSTRKKARCVQLAKAKVKCAVAWSHGGQDYFGAITVAFVVNQNSVTWRHRYKIQWGSHSCLSSGSSRCVVHTRTD